MQRNVVALADKEYDALAAPLVDEACRIIRQIAAARVYLLPVIIASLEPYTHGDDVGENSGAVTVKVPNPHRPHFRIHTR
jgi:hypothetical protein